jgi:hypothetical protein
VIRPGGVLAVLLVLATLTISGHPMSVVNADLHSGHEHGAAYTPVSLSADFGDHAPVFRHACCVATCCATLALAAPVYVASVRRVTPQPTGLSLAASLAPEISPPPPKPI